MARKDRPYLPLYVQDFMTDERLMECSASATGVFIKTMCVLHKCEIYGKLLLKQKDKQSDNQILNFATKLAKHLPFKIDTIVGGLTELIDEGCLIIEGDFLYQKRMFYDGELSATRSKTGGKGGKATQEKNKDFAKAKNEANSDIDIDNSISTLTIYNNGLSKYLKDEFEERKVTDVPQQIYFDMVVKEMNNVWMKWKPNYSFLQEADYPALLRIAYLIAQRKKISKYETVNVKEEEIIKSFEKIAEFLANTESKFFKKLALSGISNPKNFQSIEEEMRTAKQSDKQQQLEEKRILPENYFT